MWSLNIKYCREEASGGRGAGGRAVAKGGPPFASCSCSSSYSPPKTWPYPHTRPLPAASYRMGFPGGKEQGALCSNCNCHCPPPSAAPSAAAPSPPPPHLVPLSVMSMAQTNMEREDVETALGAKSPIAWPEREPRQGSRGQGAGGQRQRRESERREENENENEDTIGQLEGYK